MESPPARARPTDANLRRWPKGEIAPGMREHAEAARRERPCGGTTKAGAPCRFFPVKGETFCRHHGGADTSPSPQAIGARRRRWRERLALPPHARNAAGPLAPPPPVPRHLRALGYLAATGPDAEARAKAARIEAETRARKVMAAPAVPPALLAHPAWHAAEALPPDARRMAQAALLTAWRAMVEGADGAPWRATVQTVAGARGA